MCLHLHDRHIRSIFIQTFVWEFIRRMIGRQVKILSRKKNQRLCVCLQLFLVGRFGEKPLHMKKFKSHESVVQADSVTDIQAHWQARRLDTLSSNGFPFLNDSTSRHSTRLCSKQNSQTIIQQMPILIFYNHLNGEKSLNYVRSSSDNKV
jgi:hypothetical protein